MQIQPSALPADSGPGAKRALSQKTIRQDDLPAPPAGIMMVMRAAGDGDVSLGRLAKLVEKEPTMTAMLLRMANSSAYGTGRSVRSVSQATIFLGARVIRNMALSHAVRAMSRKTDTGGFDQAKFWEDSLRRGAAALILAEEAGFEEPSEAFTVGLLQDLGTLIFAVQWPKLGAKIQKLQDNPGPYRLEHERLMFGRTHVEMFVEAAREWGFPDDIIDAVWASHLDDFHFEDRRAQRLAELARAADVLADLGQTRGIDYTVIRAQAILEALPSRKKLELGPVHDRLCEVMRDISQDLNIGIDEQSDYECLMATANQKLISINNDYENLTQQLEKLLREKEELTRKLKASNEALRRMATTDSLTGVGNRRSFSTALSSALEALGPDTLPLTLISLDIDHFKAVNDTYGHAGGDDVLVAIAKRLSALLRTGDLIGRLGGEEFSILLPNCGEQAGELVAERLRRQLDCDPVRCRDGREVPISASFGGITLDRPTSCDDALRATDEALYVSKEAGRNRVTWSQVSGRFVDGENAQRIEFLIKPDAE